MRQGWSAWVKRLTARCEQCAACISLRLDSGKGHFSFWQRCHWHSSSRTRLASFLAPGAHNPSSIGADLSEEHVLSCQAVWKHHSARVLARQRLQCSYQRMCGQRWMAACAAHIGAAEDIRACRRCRRPRVLILIKQTLASKARHARQARSSVTVVLFLRWTVTRPGLVPTRSALASPTVLWMLWPATRQQMAAGITSFLRHDDSPSLPRPDRLQLCHQRMWARRSWDCACFT